MLINRKFIVREIRVCECGPKLTVPLATASLHHTALVVFRGSRTLKMPDTSNGRRTRTAEAGSVSRDEHVHGFAAFELNAHPASQ